MINVLNIPDPFVQRYKPFLSEWVTRMKMGTWKSGECGIPLVGGAADTADVDENGERPWLVAWLVAVRFKDGVAIMPKTKADHDLIKRHVAQMREENRHHRPELPVDKKRKTLN